MSSILILSLAAIASGDAAPVPEPGTHGHFRVLTGKANVAPPFDVVDFRYGPGGEGPGGGTWWEVSARPAGAAEPLFRLRCLTDRDPLGDGAVPLAFRRYALRIPSTGETLEYRDRHSGGALLPPWEDFERGFVPRPARATGRQDGVPESAEYLGHVLTLQYVGHGVPWDPWPDATVLDLDPELLVGTGRNFRDAEGHRLPQVPERTNYTYVPFVEDEYPTMIEAGINLFLVDEKQFPWVRGRPVFHIRSAGKNLAWPADLYRSNYLGPVMFIDEPGIITVGDKNIHDTLRYFADAAAVIRKRIREGLFSAGSYGAYRLERSLLEAGVNLGDLRLRQLGIPSWETLFETAHYQIEAGVAGVVHEGRYALGPFDEALARLSGTPRKHAARELLLWHFAILRGAARATGGSWGTSIYGQCDPAIAGEAVELAWDLGARYVWFWTSDHDHHMPWPEQLALARRLKRHAAARPRPSIRAEPPVLDRAIVIPDGDFASLENLWWVRVLDREGKNEASLRYARLLRGVIREFHEAVDAGESFDIRIDAGIPAEKGYRSVRRVTGEEAAALSR